MSTIGVDVGGTKIAAGVVDDAGRIVARKLVPTVADDAERIVADIVAVAQNLAGQTPGVAAVGVGAAGLVDVAEGLILGGPNLAYRNVPLGKTLSSQLDIPAIVDNDANVAALAEAVYGAGRDAGDQVMVTVGTGIGGGIIIGGQIYRGHYGLGAEIGHMVIDTGGPVCPCGNHGCWEAVASGRAIGRLARQRVEGGAGADLLARAGSVEAITGELVGAAAVAGDPFARDVVEEIGRLFGIGLANLVNIFDPEVIVVGGGAAAGTGELLLGPAREAMTSHILGIAWARAVARVVPAALGNQAGIVGAALLARDVARP